MKAYSMDLRVRVLADCDAGVKTRVVARKYSVSPAWVRRLKQRRRETGETTPRQAQRQPPPRQAHAAQLQERVRAQPDATLAELRDHLQQAVSVATVWRALKDLGLTLKKKSSAPPSRIGRTSTPVAPPGVRR